MTYKDKCKRVSKELKLLAKSLEREEKQLKEKYHKLYKACGVNGVFSRNERFLKCEIDVVGLRHQADFLLAVAVPQWIAMNKPEDFKW